MRMDTAARPPPPVHMYMHMCMCTYDYTNMQLCKTCTRMDMAARPPPYKGASAGGEGARRLAGEPRAARHRVDEER